MSMAVKIGITILLLFVAVATVSWVKFTRLDEKHKQTDKLRNLK